MNEMNWFTPGRSEKLEKGEQRSRGPQPISRCFGGLALTLISAMMSVQDERNQPYAWFPKHERL